MLWFAMLYLKGRSYLAARGFLSHLLDEVPDWTSLDGELVSDWSLDALPEAPRSEAAIVRRPVYWTRTQWLEPFILEYDSISQAAKSLKAIQRNWAAYPTVLQRRTALISEALPPLPSKPKIFPFELPRTPMGGFTLLDEHRLLGSARCSSPFPNGEFSFVEDKEGPPSRAYRKLWEALVISGRLPAPGETCVDAGASPGGWTWALAQLGAKVLAVDRAPLEERVAAMPGVSYLQHDAFTLKPTDLGPVDWLFSDVICYPEALYAWVSAWREAGLAKNFICTIKMQGPTFDATATERFASIPGSKIIHLWHNRHELTWINLRS
ncbi:MAG: hypothetical protein NT061_02430 [Spirochaetes bacterium]|nr:hypothetical protein [Spirochaetota bacterium]